MCLFQLKSVQLWFTGCTCFLLDTSHMLSWTHRCFTFFLLKEIWNTLCQERMASISSHPPIFLIVSLLTIGKSQVYQDRGVLLSCCWQGENPCLFLKKNFFFTLMYILWDLSSLTRDWTQALSTESAKCWPLASLGVQKFHVWIRIFRVSSLLHVQSRKEIEWMILGTELCPK